ncbi:MAG: UDP-N-acetylmuramyl-tripeptide synthetase [Spirochaetales bacterium]|nr:UDP-N-acetylmuramyl-tripeptide synthetase [Spirochaetales bacterium]
MSALLGRIPVLQQTGGDREITGIHYDSRFCRPGSLFAALPGLQTDGHRFIPQALAAGAAAVLYSNPETPPDPRAAFIRTPDPRRALSLLAAAFYDDPSLSLKVAGVTGTDGKTSTVYLIHQLLQLKGFKSGFLSTAAVGLGEDIEKNPFHQSTPEAPEVHKFLHRAAQGGEFAVLETTSHGLSPLTGRLGDVHFTGAVFTNISHEHLEFHHSFENYLRDKTRLFEKAARGKGAFGVINRDDPHWRAFYEAGRRVNPGMVMALYSRTDPAADLYCRDIRSDDAGSDFTLAAGGRNLTGRINIPGAFFVENALAALLTAGALTALGPEEFLPLLPRLKGVQGRMERISQGQPWRVILDYAHTPGAFERLLPDIRRSAEGRVIAVFGSAGERDRQKRPMLGALADRFCDVLILADEDPRGEEGMAILKEVAAGAPGRREGEDLFLIPPRKEAILKAFHLARRGDTVLLLGKGHESSIIYADGPLPWDEGTAARDCLGELGYQCS